MSEHEKGGWVAAARFLPRITALGTATPSSPSNDRGAHFCRCTRQSCKKSARIKVLVDNTHGDKTVSIIQTYCIIKVVKDKKITKMKKRTADVVIAVATDV